MEQEMKTEQPNYDVLEYNRGYKEGLTYEWKKTHDYVTGAPRSPMSPVDLKLIEEKMFSKDDNSESYKAGFKFAQQQYYKYTPDEQIQIMSRIR